MKRQSLSKISLYCLVLALIIPAAIDVDAAIRRKRKPRPKLNHVVQAAKLPAMPIGMTPADRAMLLQSFTDEEIIVERRKRLLEMYTAEELTAEYEKRGLKTDE